MNILLLSFLLWLSDNRSFDNIARGNRARVSSQLAYQNANYLEASIAYRQVLSSSAFAEPEARLNLAHSYFKLNQLQNAQRYYEQLGKLRNASLAARAQMQLGVIYTLRKDTVSALRYFRKSLVTNPENRLAAYNLELLEKQYSGAMPSPKPPAPQAQKSKAVAPSPPPQQSAEVQKSEDKKELLARLKNLDMDEAQALMLLNALKNSEIQYLQQQKRKTTNTNRGKW